MKLKIRQMLTYVAMLECDLGVYGRRERSRKRDGQYLKLLPLGRELTADRNLRSEGRGDSALETSTNLELGFQWNQMDEF